MDNTTNQPQEREIRVRTEHEVVDGLIRISPLLRTLDDLNVVSRHFLTLHKPMVASNVWSAAHGPLAINKDSILFVIELSGPPRERGRGTGAEEGDHPKRAAIRLRVGDYLVQGFFHVPPGGNALNRLYQDSHPFVALTSASISRGDAEFSAPFLAVNRSHILAAQEVRDNTPLAIAGGAGG